MSSNGQSEEQREPEGIEKRHNCKDYQEYVDLKCTELQETILIGKLLCSPLCTIATSNKLRLSFAKVYLYSPP